MKELFLKKHGLPGVGVSGLPGENGIDGAGVYIGHINQFFKMVDIDIDNFVKIGKRADITITVSNETKKYSDAVREQINTEILDTSFVEEAITALLAYTHGYYTGGITGADDKTYLFDLDNNVLLLQCQLTNTPIKDKFDDTNFKREFTVKNMDEYELQDKAIIYKNMFQHTLSGGVPILGTPENAILPTNNKITYETDNLPVRSGILFDKTYLNENLEEIITPVPSLYQYEYKRDIIEYPSTNTKYYTDILDSSALLENWGGNMTITVNILENVNPGGVNPLNFDSPYYRRAALVLPLKSSVLFSDTDGNNFYGYSDLSTLQNCHNASAIITEVTHNAAIFNDNAAATEHYANLYFTNMSGSADPDNHDNQYIMWTTLTNNKTTIPTYLKDEYKVGDTIYFYLIQPVNSGDVQILYKIVLTEEILNQPVDTTRFIQMAQFYEPFKITYIDTKNDRHICYYKCDIPFNKSVPGDTSLKIKEFNTYAAMNIINSYTDNKLLLLNMGDTLQDYLQLSANMTDSIEIFDISCGETLNISTSTGLCLSSLYLDKNIRYDSIEQKYCIQDPNIISDEFLEPVTDLDLYVMDNTPYFGCNLTASTYFRNGTELNDYIYGYEVFNLTNNDGTRVAFDTTSDTSVFLSIFPDKPEDVSILKYGIQVFAGSKTGIKRYSKMSVFEISYDGDKCESYGITGILGYDTDIIGETPHLLTFDFLTGLTAEETSGATLNIHKPATASVNSITVNNNKIMVDDNSVYKLTHWLSAKKTETGDDILIRIDCSSNLPTCQSIDEIMQSDSDPVLNINENLPDNFDCELFKKSENLGYLMPATKQRSVVFAINYTMDGNVYTETYKVTLPGFSDFRGFPNFKLDTHMNMQELANFNNTEAGVQANKFVTYLDINISDFYDKWGRYTDDATLSFTVENIDTDIQWESINSVASRPTRATVKMLIDENDVISQDYSFDDNVVYKNYVALNVTKSESSDVSNFESIDVSVKNMITPDSDSIFEHGDKKYVLLTDNVLLLLKNQANISKGLQYKIKINVSDLPIKETINKTLRYKIEFELGNPVPANLYLRFAVTKIEVKYKDKTFTSQVTDIQNITSENKFTLYTISEDFKESYKFISQPIDVMVNPVSYVACPVSQEKQIGNIIGNVVKEGSDKQIHHGLYFYGGYAYKSSELVNLKPNEINIHQLYDWKSFILRNNSFLDNIQSINVTPCKPLKSVLFTDDQLNDVIPDTIKGEKYLGIVYSQDVLSIRKYDNSNMFTYNKKQYNAERYAQQQNGSPLFTSQNISLPLRDNKLYNSLSIWNFEYTEYYKKNPKTYTNQYKGAVNEFGNGYMFLPSSVDTAQYGYKGNSLDMYKKQIGAYSNYNVYSLTDLKTLMKSTVFDSSVYSDIKPAANNTAPAASGYFRTLLYNLKWQYPDYQVIDNKQYIVPYFIVSDIDYLALNYSNLKNDVSNNKYLNTCAEYLKRQIMPLADNNDIQFKTIPASLIYDIYPRIAYNTETETFNCLMLRRPAIENDTDKFIAPPDNNDQQTPVIWPDNVQTYALSTRYYTDVSLNELAIPYPINN